MGRNEAIDILPSGQTIGRAAPGAGVTRDLMCEDNHNAKPGATTGASPHGQSQAGGHPMPSETLGPDLPGASAPTAGTMPSASATEQLRVAFLGQDIDAAKELASLIPAWAAAQGAVEQPGEPGAPKPVAGLYVYAGAAAEELAESIAFACEGAWAPIRFAGMAHVARERHIALLGASLVVDATSLDDGASRQDDPIIGSGSPAPYDASTLSLDMALLARGAHLVTLGTGTPAARQLADALLPTT